MESEPLTPPKETARVTWGPLAAVLVTVGAYLASMTFGAALVTVFPLLQGWTQEQISAWLENSITAQFMFGLTVEIVMLVLLFAFLRSRHAGLASIGLRKPKLHDAGYALLGLVMYLPLLVLVLTVVQRLVPGIDIDQRQQLGFEAAAAPLELAMVFVSLVLLPPIVEEITVRGFLYTGLKSRLPLIAAALLSSVMFAAAHLQLGMGMPPLWTAAIDTLVLSFVLIYLREVTNGLWAPIGLHMLKNGLAFTLLFVFRVQ